MASRQILAGIRVLDFTWVLVGPYVTRMLADFGAEVIKIEPPLPRADDAFSRGYYNTWNRNKLGIVLNLDKPEGIALTRRLVGISDAVIENFSPRVMANWGLDYSNLTKIKPDIIMLSMAAMGQTGPWRDYVGFGTTVHAFSGMTYLTSYPGKPPTGPGFSYADHAAGLTACLALLGAFEYRQRTGRGQYIDLSEVEATANLLGGAISSYTLSGVAPEPEANRCGQAAPHGVYRCQGDDRWCAIAVFTEAEWQGFKLALGNPHWAEGEKFRSPTARVKNIAELDRLVESWTKERTAEEVMETLQAHGVAAGVVQSAHDIAHDPQLRARGFFVEMEQPGRGTTISDASPIRLTRAPAEYRRAAPVPGQDDDYVFGALLGLSREEIVRLKRAGII